MGKKKIPELFGQGTQSAHIENAGETLGKHVKRLEAAERTQKNTKRTQKEYIENTERTRFKKYKKTELKTFSIRLQPRDIVTLTKYFTRRGLGVSQGIRQIVLDFIEREGLE